MVNTQNKIGISFTMGMSWRKLQLDDETNHLKLVIICNNYVTIVDTT